MPRSLVSTLAVLLLLVTFPAGAELLVSSDAAPARGDIGTARITVKNLGGVAATNITLRASVSGRTGVEPSAGWDCPFTPSELVCTRAALAPGESATVDLRVEFGGAISRRPVFANVGWTEAGRSRGASAHAASVANHRRFTVTNAADDGDGSLRATLAALHNDPGCLTQPCLVEFAIPGDAPRIVLRSPLPRITDQDFTIDGRTATGGKVLLDGSALTAGHGLELGAFRGEVRNLAIGGFPANGIDFRGPFTAGRGTYLAVDNYIGTDATGNAPLPNFRGIVLGGTVAHGSVIRGNVISGNTRSAIFDWSMHDPSGPLSAVLRIEENRIGLAAQSDVPLPNGASGIFFGPGSEGGLVAGNTIAFNREFGISIARGAVHVRILANSLFANGSAIDVGLDGPTADIPSNSVPYRRAAITSAVYDAATNTTTIRGTPGVTPNEVGDFSISNTVALYANDVREHGEYAEAKQYLGDAVPGAPNTWVLTFAGDLRGKFVTALSHRALMIVGTEYFDAAELSPAVEVH